MNKHSLQTTCLLLVFLGATVCAQTEKPKYSMKEYQAYQKIRIETEPLAKEKAIFAFFDHYTGSDLASYVTYELQTVLETRMRANQFGRVEEVAKIVKGKYPDGLNVADWALCRVALARNDTSSYFQVAEELLKRKPTVALACEVVMIAAKAADLPRCDRWATLVGEKGTTREKLDLYAGLCRELQNVNQEAKAAAYAEKLVTLLNAPTQPADFEGDWAASQEQLLNPSYGLIGMAAYNEKDYPKAISAFEQILKRSPKDAASHFYVGSAYLLDGKGKLAVDSFARAVVLKVDPLSAKADELIRKIIAETGADQANYDVCLQKAREELGLVPAPPPTEPSPAPSPAEPPPTPKS